MWRKNSIDERAKYYLQLQKEREVREEREKQELERRRKEEDQLIAQETEKETKSDRQTSKSNFECEVGVL